MKPGKKPQLYTGIVLHLLGDSGLREYRLKPLSRGNFIKSLERFGGVGVVALKDFDPIARPRLTSPEEVELDDGAEFVVVIPATGNFAERVSVASTSS